MILDVSIPRTYKPIRSSRRTEVVLWLLALVVLASWAILRNNSATILVLTPILALFLGLFAAALSLGNWMDRKTELLLGPDGVSFKNGLREQTFTWSQIEQVRVIRAQLSASQVFVIGEHARFSFKTLGVARSRGKELGKSGFEDGDDILETILAKSGLRRLADSSDTNIYYARE